MLLRPTSPSFQDTACTHIPYSLQPICPQLSCNYTSQFSFVLLEMCMADFFQCVQCESKEYAGSDLHTSTPLTYEHKNI